MLLFGCLLAMVMAVAPRLVLILAWIFSDRWDRVFDTWIWPLLGVIFVPYTTIMYILVWTPNGIEGWDWLWIGMGVLLDIMKWSQIANNREIPSGEEAAPPPAAPAAEPPPAPAE